MKDDDSKILTLKECAEYLKVSSSTLYRLVRDEGISGVIKIGNQWRFNKELIDEWWAKSRKRTERRM